MTTEQPKTTVEDEKATCSVVTRDKKAFLFYETTFLHYKKPKTRRHYLCLEHARLARMVREELEVEVQWIHRAKL